MALLIIMGLLFSAVVGMLIITVFNKFGTGWGILGVFIGLGSAIGIINEVMKFLMKIEF